MTLRKALFKLYWRIEGAMVPGLQYSQRLYEEWLESHVTPGIAWLDLGCGHQILPRWRLDEERRLVSLSGLVVGVDYETNALKNHQTLSNRVRGDIGKLPFTSDTFDLATANMVLEHLSDPESQLREICRVLKPGGLFLFHTPNVLGYTTMMARLIPGVVKKKLIHLLDRRSGEEVFPTYYRANSFRRIRTLAAATGFQSVQIRPTASTATFAVIPPLAVVELVWIRIILTKRFRRLRPNLIGALRKARPLDG